jgi:ribonuclease HI
MKKYIVNTDGGARSNPGPAGVGGVIADENGVTIKEFSGYIGKQTNNFAEYEAVIFAIAQLKKLVPEKDRSNVQIDFRIDSELVVKQLNGEYQIKDESLQLQFVKVWNVRVKDFPNIIFTHVRREENKRADALANEAMDSGTARLM